ncbi:ATP-binding cassette domain-containing protein [bacterium]|nr:ATP-binding cassette domain-containing protein [bacterium]
MPDANDGLIAAQSLGYRYRRRGWRTVSQGERESLDKVSFHVPCGHVVAILGLSGSGKTTLLKALGLLLDPGQMQGNLIFGGQDYACLSQAEQVAFRAKRFGFVFQSANMLSAFSCLDNILLPTRLQRFDLRQQKNVVRMAVDCLCDDRRQRREIFGVLRKRPSQISGGQRQRMAVVRAVAHNPDVVFADEPCASLDAVNSEHVMRLMLRWQQGRLSRCSEVARKNKTLFLVTHNTTQALDAAEYFLFLHDGKLVGGKGFHRDELPVRQGRIAVDKVERAMNTGEVEGFLLNG